MKAADLRKTILQAAAQGKLVPQDKNDEPASELLKRIQAEKTVLIKEGKLKKEKPLPPITEDEIPYDLPDGWVWCRLGSIGITNIGLTYKPTDITPSGVPVLRSGNIQDNRLDLSDLIFVSCDIPKQLFAKPGDILICARNGSKRLVGKSAIIQTAGMTFGAFMAIFRSPLNHYIHKYLNSDVFMSQIHGNTSDTTTINQITQNMLKSAMCPIPPLNEQHRIVAKVDELMTMCDEVESAEEELDTLEEHFIDYLPKSILQAAVQGKLVPQDKNDEPASELLARIQAEKTALSKDGKLKKEKPLPSITEDEIPFDLPDGWMWCRLGNIIFDNVGGGTPSKQHPEYWDGDIPWASVKDLNCDILTQTQDYITQLGLDNSTSNLIQPDTIIVCMRMGLGKIAVSKIAVAINQDLRALTLSKGNVLTDYFVDWYKTLTIEGGGMTVKGITISELSNLLFPLPPLAEQRRIVAKVDELMAMCDELKHVADQPIGNDKVVPFPVAQPAVEPIAMAARGDAENLSAQARQAIEDLFGEDE